MGTNETFCLNWNDFESNISVAFREIREEQDLFDCTLSCGSRQIQAHKLILSACSPFFKSILRQNPHQHPLLYLKGVKFTDLQAVLDFMYHGKVNVAREDLSSFLAVAEDLQVKGLTETIKKTAKSQEYPASLLEITSGQPGQQSSTNDDEIQAEDIEHGSDSDILEPYSYMYCGQKFDEYEDFHDHLKQVHKFEW